MRGRMIPAAKIADRMIERHRVPEQTCGQCGRKFVSRQHQPCRECGASLCSWLCNETHACTHDSDDLPI